MGMRRVVEATSRIPNLAMFKAMSRADTDHCAWQTAGAGSGQFLSSDASPVALALIRHPPTVDEAHVVVAATPRWPKALA
jgi:hypothetical protein